MKKINGIVVVFAVLAVSSTAIAQTNLPDRQAGLDSLYSVWQDETQPDSTRAKAYKDYVWKGFLFTQPDTAFVLAERLISFGREKKNLRAEAHGYSIQGISWYNRSDLLKALEYYEQCLEVQERAGDKTGMARSMSYFGMVYGAQGDYTKALEYYGRSLKIQEENGNKKGAIASLDINIGVVYLNIGDLPKALYHFDRSIAVSEEIGDRRRVSTALGNKGIVLIEQGNYPKALECFKQSLKIHEEAGEKGAVAGILISLGGIYNLQGDFAQSQDYYTQSLKINEEIGNKTGMAVAYVNLGDIFREQGDTIRSLESFEQSLKINEQIGANSAIAGSLVRIGNLYRELGDHPKALDYSIRSLTISEESGDEKSMIYSLFVVGATYNGQGKYSKAVTYCERSLELSKKMDIIDRQKLACDCLYDANKALGNSKNALNYLELSSALDDSLNETETAKKLQRYEFDKELLADSLRQEEEKHSIELAHQSEVAEKDKTRNMLMGGGLLLLLIAGGLFSRNRYVNRSKKQIQKEKDRSEELLLNILPEEVAEELKDKGAAEAQLIDETTVLFTDFKGFTAMSEKLSPKELVNDLNICFSEFDHITAKYGIEKIKTIGDAYMAAGGLPTPNNTHATDVIKAAFEMRDFVEAGKARKIEAGLPYFEVRIGIHTGPVVAGIVGVKKFQYDIWGDTVNTASRMESSGEVGQVNISEATYELVKENSEFSFTSRGKVKAKGKGEMEMFFVTQNAD